MENKLAMVPQSQILGMIAEQQKIQATAPNTHCKQWQEASNKLQPLFAEMANRNL